MNALDNGAGAPGRGLGRDPPDQGRLGQLAEEQAALRRVATLVARATPPEEVFATVAELAGSTREQPLPADTEARLVSFTELVATAIANAQSRAELIASRARIVAAADEARRRIERDLHDGTQQQLVSLLLDVRAAQAALPPELEGRLSRIAERVTGVFNQVREISHGIHPAILSEQGLQAALKALARRSAVPVELDLRTGRRLPGHVEVAAYYAVSEALANAAKHARDMLERLSPDRACAPDLPRARLEVAASQVSGVTGG